MMSPQFERVAGAVAERVSELLCAPTSVVDSQGRVIISSESRFVGFPLDLQPPHESPFLRVPLRLDGQHGEVIVGTPEGDETVSPRVAQALVELMINQTAAVGHHPNQHELKNAFISNLLHGFLTDEQAILREAQVLGLDFTPPRAVILIDAADYILATDDQHEQADAQVQRRAHLVISQIVSFFHLPNDTICAYIGEGQVAVLKASNTKNLVSWADGCDAQEPSSSSWANLAALRRAGDQLLRRLRADTGASISLGIGRYHPGVCGLSRSYQDARAALSLGRRFHGLNGVHCLDRLGIAAFVGVADERTKVELATHLLSPLDHEPELIDTLAVFFSENCSPSATAANLSIHRNTLAYRLEKIASLTGLDPRQFDAAVQIRLALVLRSLQNGTSGGGHYALAAA